MQFFLHQSWHNKSVLMRKGRSWDETHANSDTVQSTDRQYYVFQQN